MKTQFLHCILCPLWPTGVSEEAGPQIVSGRLPVEACPAHHKVPAHAEGDHHILLDHFNISFVFFKYTVQNVVLGPDFDNMVL